MAWSLQITRSRFSWAGRSRISGDRRQAEGLRWGYTGRGPLRHGAASAGPQVAFPAVSERAAVPARVVSPGQPSGLACHALAPAVRRHVEQSEGPAGQQSVPRPVAEQVRNTRSPSRRKLLKTPMSPPIGLSAPRTEYQGSV